MEGGEFTSMFERIIANVIFTSVGGNPTNPIDILHMTTDTIDLTSKGSWTHTEPEKDPHTNQVFAGGFYIGDDLEHTGPHPPVIANTPVPAAVWLFFSGFIGLIGFNRRKRL